MPAESPTLFPSMRYRDAPAAIEFLKAAFGFEDHEVIANPDGTIAHAELRFGPSILMLGSSRENDQFGDRVGAGWLYVSIDDADAQYERARQAGAEVVMELHDTDYGSRDFAVRDLEGNFWSFGTYRPAPIEGAA